MSALRSRDTLKHVAGPSSREELRQEIERLEREGEWSEADRWRSVLPHLEDWSVIFQLDDAGLLDDEDE